jgi:hypothetical protein
MPVTMRVEAVFVPGDPLPRAGDERVASLNEGV